jgi:hypothetical protein
METRAEQDCGSRSIILKAIPIDIDWHPGLSVYASEKFLKTVADEYGWIGGIDEAGRLRCLLPYTIIRKTMVRMARFRVETIPLGEGIDLEEEKQFLNRVIEYLRSINVDIVIPASTNTIFQTYPDGAVAAPYGTHLIDLTDSEEMIWKNVHSKHRNVIRNAAKKRVEILNGSEDLRTVFRLIHDTFQRSKLSFMSFGSFERMVLGLGENVKLLIARHAGAAQGCAVIPFSDQRAYYAYGGSVPHPLTGAMNFLQWESIRYFRNLGVKDYDFCGARINPLPGSKQAGIIMYKERFGARLHHGYMWKYALNSIKSALYSLGVRLFRGGDIVDAEHHKLEASSIGNSDRLSGGLNL